MHQDSSAAVAEVGSEAQVSSASVPSKRPRSRRIVARLRKRFQIRFDAKGVGGTGFTGNVSPSGMLIHSKLTTSPGTVLRGKMFLPDGAAMEFEAEVRWVHKAIGQLAELFRNSMGLRFVAPPGEAYFQLLVKPSTDR